ncbi:hypothetical protein CAPTEDRAFT_211810 [Capitella teleta]|uniref:Uncharacterized protein n=1 Tax=Capitella teleta TaxID=283909 RepID=R7VA89_CAPTE|nr:hypothetical protein CAPTEDRAFT_211810 [Capitella teleta]|eukprot:ELU13241.1 hypothetical protein CAPTEDRAFT_211810 [Capitella teleta]
MSGKGGKRTIGVSCGEESISFRSRKKRQGAFIMTVRAFYAFIMDASVVLEWIFEFVLSKQNCECPVCKEPRRRRCLNYLMDEWIWRVKNEISEIMELTFWWVRDDKQDTTMNETGHGVHTIVDWGNFMRESSLVYLDKFGDMRKIGGRE